MAKKIFEKLSSICTGAAAVSLGIVTATVIINIIGRLFNSPLKGMYEIVQYGTMTTICLALSKTGFLKKHVRVEMFSEKLPAKPRAAAEFLQMLIPAAAFVVVLCLLCFKLIPETLSTGRVTDIFRVPYYLVYVILAVGMILAALMFLYHAVLCILPLFGKGGDSGPENKTDPGVIDVETLSKF